MLPFTRILLPVDFSERAACAVRSIVPLAKRFDSEIILLHVLQPYHEFGGVELAAAILTDLVAERARESERRTREFMPAELAGLRVRRVMREGDPAHEIVQCAASVSAGLIVIPTHGYGPIRRMLLGSVTAKVLHDADCPVWTTALSPERYPAINIRRVLCGLDLAPGSLAVLRCAAELAGAFGAQLQVVHAMEELDPRTESYYFSPEWRKFLVDAAEKELAALQQQAGTCAGLTLTTGPASEMICEEARKTDSDLLVIGRGGHAGLLGRLAKQAYAMIRQSPCLVFSV